MASRFNPRGDLPLPMFQPFTYAHSRSNLLLGEKKHSSRRLSSLSLNTKSRTKSCYDWIFSSGSNVHIAVDRSAFKEYTPFDSYVLALSDQGQVQVRGVGSVELKIKRAPESKESHTVLLTNVLHVPSWLCNVFSDVHFDTGHDYEHTWGRCGVQFSKREAGGLRAWGYTESFCGLDRLILAKRHKESRSPMLEDKDREVFSINVTWPLSQRERWVASFMRNQKQIQRPFHTSSECGLAIFENLVNDDVMLNRNSVSTGPTARRATLSDLNANVIRQLPSRRISSLKATTSQKELLGG